ncbi:sigma-54-dependent transcriptional regulator [Alteribacillus sp. HJP-4]|uniref:sigma-54-dependent transcriptional regulator n=1 Tax=Alteribacillus sp. HJP-4 TaxID=2775394 RepID=UPI0035CD1F7C
MNILIIDDDQEIRELFQYLCHSHGHHPITASDRASSEKAIDKTMNVDFAFIDLKLPDVTGLELLKTIKIKFPAGKAIMMTGYSTVKTAVEAIRLGAEDYLEKPFDDIAVIEKVLESTDHTAPPFSTQLLAEKSGMFIGQSPRMQETLRLAATFASKNINILIEGETGTGKEKLAQFIHELSAADENSPFLAINCGALAEQVLESELFGHEAGAFTGAVKTRKGVFELASTGTLLLDEIGEADLSIQVKLLRVLETREFMRVGGEKVRRTGARIIASTNRNLHEEADKGVFRKDLLYRLEVVTLTMPPLRQRMEDIEELAYFLLQEQGFDTMQLSREALQLLKAHDWPGNIRELTNVLMRAAAITEGVKNVIEKSAILIHKSNGGNTSTASESAPLPLETMTAAGPLSKTWKHKYLHRIEEGNELSIDAIIEELREAEKDISREFAQKALDYTDGDRRKAAEMLGINSRKLRYILNEKGN